jgi:hypothetical protein
MFETTQRYKFGAPRACDKTLLKDSQAMLEVAKIPKYRSAGYVKLTPLYIDFRPKNGRQQESLARGFLVHLWSNNYSRALKNGFQRHPYRQVSMGYGQNRRCHGIFGKFEERQAAGGIRGNRRG